MKFLFSCLLLLATTSLVSAQQSGKHPSLTRAQTKETEARLSAMGYWTGAVDGLFEPAAQSAVIAFQKWEGRSITAQLTLDELKAIRTSAPPKARELGYAHVEVDLDHQVLLLFNAEGRVKILPVSTGSGKEFMEDGETSIAYTPRGRFVVYDKTIGWEKGALAMYYSNYISGGVAIHGTLLSQSNQRAMAVFACPFSPLAKSASYCGWEQSCWCTTRSRSSLQSPGLKTPS